MGWPITFRPVVTPSGEVIPCRNEVRFQDGLAFLKASNCDAEFMVDEADLRAVAPHRWSFNNGYAKCCHKSKTISMAWLLCDGWVPGSVVDHVNRVRHDNRRSNLRLSSLTDNAHNLSVFKTNTTGYPGVSFHRLAKKWHAEMAYHEGGKRVKKSGGYFASYRDACMKSKEMREARGYFTHPLPPEDFTPSIP